MKKQKSIPLVLLIIIIIAIVFFVSKLITNKNEETQKLTQIYELLNTKQKYLFEIQQNSNNKTIMAKNIDKIVIDKYSENNHESTLIKDNHTYFILHDKEEYYIYPPNNVEQNFLIDGFKEIIEKDFVTGHEKIMGKKYFYEEYNGSTIFMITNTLDLTDDNIKTRFYFDKDNNLAYIKTITGEKQELLKVKLETHVNDDVFEIPSHYAEG